MEAGFDFLVPRLASNIGVAMSRVQEEARLLCLLAQINL